jgi:hypothetical protein
MAMKFDRLISFFIICLVMIVIRRKIYLPPPILPIVKLTITPVYYKNIA